MPARARAWGAVVAAAAAAVEAVGPAIGWELQPKIIFLSNLGFRSSKHRLGQSTLNDSSERHCIIERAS